MASQPNDVLGFWFGAPPLTQRRAWFVKDPAFDAHIAGGFGDTIEAALAGGLAGWDATPRGRLARIIVLDQFTRNVFRGTPRAFAGDALALASAEAALAAGEDQQLDPIERIFMYLPLEHAEDVAVQRRSVAAFARLAQGHAGFDETYDYALRHQVIVERFGRFPHRNAILGRPSTEEELAFLSGPGSSF